LSNLLKDANIFSTTYENSNGKPVSLVDRQAWIEEITKVLSDFEG